MAPMGDPGQPVMTGYVYEVDVVGMNGDGEGVGRVAGFTLFVRGALPGEKVLAHVEQLKKTYGLARTARILQKSADRVTPPCLIYDECGGCQLQHLGYEAQLQQKRQFVIDALERIGKFKVAGVVKEAGSQLDAQPNVGSRVTKNAITAKSQVALVVHPTIGMADPWHYRNKAQVPFGQRGGQLIGGFYAQGSHEIIEFDTCHIQEDRNNVVVATVKRIASELGIGGYDAASGRGTLRHVIAKVGVHTGELMIVLVTNGSHLPAKEALIRNIRRDLPMVTSICHNMNTTRHSLVMGHETRVLWGAPVIHDTIGGIRFAISPRSFYQVNPAQTEILYSKALEYAQLTGRETVIDAYCGIGTISLFLAKHAHQVYGVEIVPEAIEDARANAELNGLHNVKFAVGQAETVIPAWKRSGIHADIVVVDPPRKGCDPALLRTIIQMKPSRVVYVSCDPATLARDLRILCDDGYHVTQVQPVDMFPQTAHVETVVRIERNP
jgi:23S rRNA (uracil1939-C5)-methyltransferase